MDLPIKDESAMKDLGRRIGRLLKGGEVLELIGDVGAGKTTLTKGIAEGLGVDEDVQSPSFTISRMYDAPGGLRLAHYDFYRLHNPGIMAAEMHETMNDSKTVTIIEWADIVSGILPQDHLSVHIVPVSDTARRMTMKAGGEAAHALMEGLT